jgi:hypothetical protein
MKRIRERSTRAKPQYPATSTLPAAGASLLCLLMHLVYMWGEVFVLLVLLGVQYPSAAAELGRSNSSTSPDAWSQLRTQLDTFNLFEHDLNSAFLPKWTYPIERGICGNWMQPYTQLHKDILQGKRPPRYTIHK